MNPDEGNAANGPAGQGAYRAVFVVGLVLYAAAFVAGTGYALATRGHLPEVSAHQLTQADELFERGDLARAAREYRMASLIDRTDETAAVRAVDLRKRLGDGAAVIDFYARQRDLQPTNAATYRNLAQALHANRRYAEAIASYRGAIRLDPGDARAYAGMGEVLLDQDRLPEAVASFEAAAARDPGNAATQNSLGIALALAGRKGEALARFEEAVRLKPGAYEANLQRAMGDLFSPGQPR